MSQHRQSRNGFLHVGVNYNVGPVMLGHLLYVGQAVTSPGRSRERMSSKRWTIVKYLHAHVATLRGLVTVPHAHAGLQVPGLLPRKTSSSAGAQVTCCVFDETLEKRLREKNVLILMNSLVVGKILVGQPIIHSIHIFLPLPFDRSPNQWGELFEGGLERLRKGVDRGRYHLRDHPRLFENSGLS